MNKYLPGLVDSVAEEFTGCFGEYKKGLFIARSDFNVQTRFFQVCHQGLEVFDSRIMVYPNQHLISYSLSSHKLTRLAEVVQNDILVVVRRLILEPHTRHLPAYKIPVLFPSV